MFSPRNLLSVESWAVGVLLVSSALCVLTSSERHCELHEHPIEVRSAEYNEKVILRSGICGQAVRVSELQTQPLVFIDNIPEKRNYSLLLLKENTTETYNVLWHVEHIKPYGAPPTYSLMHDLVYIRIGYMPLKNVTANYTILVIKENNTISKESETLLQPSMTYSKIFIDQFMKSRGELIGSSDFRTEAKNPLTQSHDPNLKPGQHFSQHDPNPKPDQTHFSSHDTNLRPDQPQPALMPSPQDHYDTPTPRPSNAVPFIPAQHSNHTHIPAQHSNQTNNHNNSTTFKPHSLNGNHGGKPSKGSAGLHQASISVIALTLLCLAKASF